MIKLIGLFLMLVFMACGCKKENGLEFNESTDKKKQDVEKTTEPLMIPESRAIIQIACGIEDSERITEISTRVLSDKFKECNQKRLKSIIYYDGEIGSGFSQFIRLLNGAVPETNEFLWSEGYEFTINSGGGDVKEAILAGNELSKHDWTVAVERKIRVSGMEGIVDAVIADINREDYVRPGCFSACVLFYAAATYRSYGRGQVGIHRIIPNASDAESIEHLELQLNSIRAEVLGYLQKNGVSATLLDEMMAVPSGSIRLLSDEEMNKFGLAHENSAKADLRRIMIRRKCGNKYAEDRGRFLDQRNACYSKEGTALDDCIRNALDAAFESGFMEDSCAAGDAELNAKVQRSLKRLGY